MKDLNDKTKLALAGKTTDMKHVLQKDGRKKKANLHFAPGPGRCPADLH